MYATKKSDKITFWVTNISNTNVSLLDLGLTLRARSTVNLMDSRHYHFNLEQLKKSAESGSIAAKSNKIKVRAVPPTVDVPVLVTNQDQYLPSRANFGVDVIKPVYEELELSDEAFAEENADLSEQDRRPILPKI